LKCDRQETRGKQTHSEFLLEDLFESYFFEDNGEIDFSNYLKY
jgi:hypothetical protein